MKQSKAGNQINSPAHGTVLSTAETLVYGQRSKDYGHPSQHFQNIAELWNAYIGVKIIHQNGSAHLNTIDIAALNILQKIARVATNQQHMDSWVDIAGYAATAERIIRDI